MKARCWFCGASEPLVPVTLTNSSTGHLGTVLRCEDRAACEARRGTQAEEPAAPLELGKDVTRKG